MESRRLVAVQGWDSVTEIVDGLWIERTPRRPEVRPALEVEARLMRRVAPVVPLTVPVPEVLRAGPGGDPAWRVRHRMVPGAPVDPALLTAEDGRSVGRFLRALHDLPPTTWTATGVAEDVHLHATLDRMRTEVLPRLPEDLHGAAGSLLERCGAPTPLVLVHGDLGPEHLLRTDRTVTGIIDWTDVGLRDPAIDLSWVLHGTPRIFSDSVTASYGPDGAERARAADWHRVGPWHEVLHGLDLLSAGVEAGREHVDDGLAGAGTRLRHLGH